MTSAGERETAVLGLLAGEVVRDYQRVSFTAGEKQPQDSDGCSMSSQTEVRIAAEQTLRRARRFPAAGRQSSKMLS